MSDPVVLLSTGDVVGPAGGVTDNSMVLFSGTSGKLIKGNNAQVTSAGLALLDDIDANAQLTTLGLTTTQPQFDNSVKQATTEFVQRALGNHNTVLGVNSSTVLTAAAAGSFISLFGAGSIAVTLPLGSSVPVGSKISFFCVAAPGQVFIQRQGTDVIAVSGSTVAGVDLFAGDAVDISWTGSHWAMTGSAQAKYQPGFRSSLADNGHQKLPSGLIIQWGVGYAGQNNTAFLNTFTIAFPNACLSIVAMHPGGSAGSTYVTGSPISKSQFNLFTAFPSGNITANWIAIGY